MDKAICRCKQDGPLSLNFNRWLETGMSTAASLFLTFEMMRGLNLIFHQLTWAKHGTKKEMEDNLTLEAFLLLFCFGFFSFSS